VYGEEEEKDETAEEGGEALFAMKDARGESKIYTGEKMVIKERSLLASDRAVEFVSSCGVW
jgi:hypothetical protein